MRVFRLPRRARQPPVAVRIPAPAPVAGVPDPVVFGPLYRVTYRPCGACGGAGISDGSPECKRCSTPKPGTPSQYSSLTDD